MRIFTYVQVNDGGAAPNYHPPTVTLAVCKPRIRMKAEPGDVVLGFAGRPLGPNPHGVRWAGVVAEKLSFAEYWNDSRFRGKKPNRSATPDNIYRPLEGAFVPVPNRTHGSRDVARDTGGRFVLVFDTVWRFGDAAPVLPERFGLRIIIGRRGHRVTKLSSRGWRELRAWLDALTRGGPSPPAKPTAQMQKELRAPMRCG